MTTKFVLCQFCATKIHNSHPPRRGFKFRLRQNFRVKKMLSKNYATLLSFKYFLHTYMNIMYNVQYFFPTKIHNSNAPWRTFFFRLCVMLPNFHVKKMLSKNYATLLSFKYFLHTYMNIMNKVQYFFPTKIHNSNAPWRTFFFRLCVMLPGCRSRNAKNEKLTFHGRNFEIFFRIFNMTCANGVHTTY